VTAGHDAQEWDSRYGGSERVWSGSPNAWVAATIATWTPGRALDLGAGEGRHGVWLASLGWQVTAVDFSAVGIERGRGGAQEAGVEVDWVVADLRTWEPPAGATFDLVLVAYLQLGDDILARARSWLAPGGALVVVGHALRNLTEGVGGPCDARLLHTAAGYRAASEGLVVEQLAEVVRHQLGGDAIDLVLVARRGDAGAAMNGAITNNDNSFRYPLDVRFFEVDSLGVVFNMWYLGWCDEAMSAFMESIGYGYATLRAQGVDAVLRKAELEWLDSLQAFQRAEIAVRVDRVGTTSFRLGYDIERVEAAGPGRTRCARAVITYVCVQIRDRNKVAIPVGLREALVADRI
jgi:YbgC/YbaW family acyl-CoA thioester hydrolase